MKIIIIIKINIHKWEVADAQAQTHTTTVNQMFTKTIRMNKEMWSAQLPATPGPMLSTTRMLSRSMSWEMSELRQKFIFWILMMSNRFPYLMDKQHISFEILFNNLISLTYFFIIILAYFFVYFLNAFHKLMIASIKNKKFYF